MVRQLCGPGGEPAWSLLLLRALLRLEPEGLQEQDGLLGAAGALGAFPHSTAGPGEAGPQFLMVPSVVTGGNPQRDEKVKHGAFAAAKRTGEVPGLFGCWSG